MKLNNSTNLSEEKIVVFTPTYNEVENIETFIKQVFEVLPQCSVLIVDDNSPDGTAEKVKQLQKVYPNLYLVIRKEKRGRGHAGIEGFKKSLELGADIIIEMDADLSHSPYEIPNLLKKLKENSEIDIVVGSRYIEGGKDSERNILRKLTSLFARVYLKIVTGINLQDITSGFKVYRRKVVETILPYLKSSDPFIVTEVNYLCKLFNFKFYEIPISFHNRAAGKSKLNIWKLIKYLFKVWGLVIKCFLNDKYNILFTKFLILTNIFRIFIAGSLGLTDDESHYWQYAQYLDFSYFDHPPMVGYLIYIFTKIFGNNLYGIRIVAILCFNITAIYLYRLIKEFYDTKISFYTNLLFNIIPIFFVGSIITVPDAPLGMFWMMYIFYFHKFVSTRDSWLLYLCGVILGLAGLSKYNAVFLFISTIIILYTEKDLRKILLKKDFYIFCFITLSAISPVLFWNIAHNFVSFRYQFFHGVGKENVISLFLFLQNFAYQSLYLSPFLFIFLWYFIFYFILNKKHIKEKILFYFALPGILVFNIIGFKNQILPHWPSVSYITLIPFLITKNKKFVMYFTSLISAVMLTIFVIVVATLGIIKIPEKYKDADTPDKLYGWDIAGKELYSLLQTYPENFILTHKYYSAGQMRFALSKYYKYNIPQIYSLDFDFNQYDFWYKDISKHSGKDAIFFIETRFPEEDILKNYPFNECKLLSIINFRKNPKWPERKFKFFILKNFDYEKAKKLGLIENKYNNFILVTEYFRNYDKMIFLTLNKNRFYNNKIFRISSYIITNLGNGFVLIPICIVIIFLIDKEKFLYNTIVFILIITFGGILIQILKFLFDKPRPLKLFSDMLNQPINVIGEQLRELGFPSGHTFLAFSTAIFLSDRIKKKTINNILFILAIMVGISRVLVGAHFISDVIGGLIIGIIFTIIILKIEKELN